MVTSFRGQTGKWKCGTCGRINSAMQPPTHCQCEYSDLTRAVPVRILGAVPCPWGLIVQRLTPEGLTRLDRCRSANCGMMHRVNGAITCVGMQGKKCGWQAKWIRCLNREEEFGCGGWECPHWLPLAALPEPHHDLGNAHEDQR